MSGFFGGARPPPPSPPVSSGPPEDVDAGTSSGGVLGSVSRSDHKHDVLTGVPVDIGSVNSEGASDAVTRSDHVHAHGSQAGGSTHAAATASVNGFMSATDKAKLDTLPGATETADMYPFPEARVGGNATRAAQTTFEGASYIIRRQTQINRLVFRTTNATAPGAVRILIFQTSNGGSGVASLIGTVSSFAPPTGAGNRVASFSEGTITLEAGLIYILHGLTSASGSVTLRTYTNQAMDLLSQNVDSGTHPFQFTTAIAANTTPSTFNPLTQGTGTSSNVALIARFKTV